MNRRMQILLTDDDDLFWELLQEVVADQPELGERVSLVRVPDGSDALQYLNGVGPYANRRRFPWPDLMLLDQRMPLLDGTDLLARLQQQPIGQPRPMICLFSSSGQEKLVHQAYQLGANFCMVKPLTFDALKERFRLIVEFFLNVIELPLRPETQN